MIIKIILLLRHPSIITVRYFQPCPHKLEWEWPIGIQIKLVCFYSTAQLKINNNKRYKITELELVHTVLHTYVALLLAVQQLHLAGLSGRPSCTTDCAVS